MVFLFGLLLLGGLLYFQEFSRKVLKLTLLLGGATTFGTLRYVA